MSMTTVSMGDSVAACPSMLSGGSGSRGTFVALADEPPLHARSPGPPIIAAPPARPAARRNWRRFIELIGWDCIQRPADAGARNLSAGGRRRWRGGRGLRWL